MPSALLLLTYCSWTDRKLFVTGQKFLGNLDFPCVDGWKAAMPKPGSQTSNNSEDERASLVVDLHPHHGVHLDPQPGGEANPQENGWSFQPCPACLSFGLGRIAGGGGRWRELCSTINWEDAGREGRHFQWTSQETEQDDKTVTEFKKLWSEGWSHPLSQDGIKGLCINKCNIYLEKIYLNVVMSIYICNTYSQKDLLRLIC